MTLKRYEALLQTVNSKLNIKRYGDGLAGVHEGNRFVCRVPQGEITAYTVTQPAIGYSGQFVTPTNPRGAYKYQLIMRRGRNGVARILLRQGLIKHSDLAKVSC